MKERLSSYNPLLIGSELTKDREYNVYHLRYRTWPDNQFTRTLIRRSYCFNGKTQPQKIHNIDSKIGETVPQKQKVEAARCFSRPACLPKKNIQCPPFIPNRADLFSLTWLFDACIARPWYPVIPLAHCVQNCSTFTCDFRNTRFSDRKVLGRPGFAAGISLRLLSSFLIFDSRFGLLGLVVVPCEDGIGDTLPHYSAFVRELVLWCGAYFGNWI